MWSRKPTPVDSSARPLPSRSSVRWMSVLDVVRLKVADRVMRRWIAQIVKLVPPVCEPGGVPVRLFHGPLRETPAMTQDDKTPERPKPELPGNHGQFGEDNATEDYKLLGRPAVAG